MDYRTTAIKKAQNRNLILKLQKLSNMQNITTKEAKIEAKKYKVTTLLSKGNSNAKTIKNDVKSFILYLAPFTQNNKGINLCPSASSGCAAACLHTAGLGGVYPSVGISRMNKANFYVNSKPHFIKLLAYEIQNEVKKAKGEKLVFRLNGTTDIDFIYLLKKYANLDVLSLENVYFYDYTKILQKAIRYQNAKNYSVTFSRSETNETDFLEAVKLGINTAVVFSHSLPDVYAGAKVIDGDKSDIEMIFNKGVILGLKAKGKAKTDKSGFVILTDKNI